ncbi:MAG: DMT family transporter [Patescibacteria group bacterium]
MAKNNLGFFVLLTSAFFYSTYGVFSKLVSLGFEPFTHAWTRSFITLILFLILGFSRKIYKRVKKQDIKWYVLIGIIGSLAVAPTYYSLAYLNIGTALFLQYASTVITSYIFGALFFKERLSKESIVALLMALTGLILVYWGDVNISLIIPALAAFVSGSFYSTWFVFSKKINKEYPTIQINTIGYAFAVVINLFIAVIIGESFNSDFTSTAWLGNLGYALAGFFASGLTLYGFKYIEAHKGSLILLAEILFGMAFGYLLFSEVLSSLAVIGGILIIFSIALPNIKYLLNKKK